MGIDVKWDDSAQTRLLVTVQGNWTWDEMFASADEVKAITDAAAPRIISAILDLSTGVQFPGGTMFSKTALDNAKRMLSLGKDGTGPVFVVGASPMIRMAYNTLYQLDPKTLGNVKFADSVDDARARLTG